MRPALAASSEAGRALQYGAAISAAPTLNDKDAKRETSWTKSRVSGKSESQRGYLKMAWAQLPERIPAWWIRVTRVRGRREQTEAWCRRDWYLRRPYISPSQQISPAAQWLVRLSQTGGGGVIRQKPSLSAEVRGGSRLCVGAEATPGYSERRQRSRKFDWRCVYKQTPFRSVGSRFRRVGARVGH